MIITVLIGPYAESHEFSPYPHVLLCQHLLVMTPCILVGGQQISGGVFCFYLPTTLENEKMPAGRIHVQLQHPAQ